MNRRIARLITTLGLGGLALAAQACVIRETPVNRGYGYGYAQTSYQGGISYGQSSPYYVSTLPPEPLYETMSSSPGYGYVWIDGYWDWNGYEWVWISGRWTREQSGYVYVQPYYDYDDYGRYVYYRGYWSRPERVPSRVRVVDHRDGRPATGYHPPRPASRPPVRDHRDDGGYTPPPRGGGYNPPPPRGGRDHRDPVVTPPPSRPTRPDRPAGNPPPRDNRDDRTPDTRPSTPPPRPRGDERTPPPRDQRDTRTPDRPASPPPQTRPPRPDRPAGNPPPRDNRNPDRGQRPPANDRTPPPPKSRDREPARPNDHRPPQKNRGSDHRSMLEGVKRTEVAMLDGQAAPKHVMVEGKK